MKTKVRARKSNKEYLNKVLTYNDVFDIAGLDPKNIRYPNLKIKELLDDNYIYSYNTGLYKLINDKTFFGFNKDIFLDKLIANNFSPFGFHAFYFDTFDFNPLMSLQLTKDYKIFYVDSFAEEFCMDFLKKQNKKCIDINDLAKIQTKFPYWDFDFDYIFKKIPFDMPIHHDKKENRFSPTIEGVMVDIISDKFLKNLFEPEIINIYKSVLENNIVKMDRLQRYAKKKRVINTVNTIFDEIYFDAQTGNFYD